MKRTAIIFVSGAAFAAWLYAAMTPGRPPISSGVIRPAPIDASGAALASEIARLRERLRPDPRPSEPARNPFFFRSTPPAASPTRLSAAVDLDRLPAVIAAAEAARLRLTLAGVAEDPGADGAGPVRTAIISGNGRVFLVKTGDTVADRDLVYKVGAIAADSVELHDPRDGTTTRLAFK